MNRKSLGALALALVGSLSAGAAHARGGLDLQWSVTIGGGVPLPVYAPQVYAPPVYAPQVYAPQVRSYPIYAPREPVIVVVPQGHRSRHAGWADADRDGIPNRYDRVYNPRWDVDGDGIPNRYDRSYNPRWVAQPHSDNSPRGNDRQPYRR